MATAPAFAATPKLAFGQIGTANTNRDGTGTVVDIYTAPSGGARLNRVLVTAPASSTAGIVRFFIYNGTSSRLIAELSVSSATPSGTVKCFTSFVPELVGLLLPSGYKLQAAPHNGETFNIHAELGEF